MTCVGPPNGHAPKTIRLFINQPNAMDFDSARDASPVQEITSVITWDCACDSYPNIFLFLVFLKRMFLVVT